MTVGKGARWGRPMAPPPDLAVASSDADLARLAAEARVAGRSLTAEVREGDLLRSFGLAAPRPVGERHGYPLDLGLAALDDGEPVPFVAHLVARGPLWGGPLVVVMNAPWLGELRLGPKAHPNDGLLDITAGRLPLAQRVEARRRARAGAHLPHPGLTTARAAAWSTTLPRPVRVRLDGVPRGRVRSIDVEIVPDAITLVV